MSAVADILKSAIERQSAASAQALADVREKCEAANTQLKKSLLEIRVEQLSAMKAMLSGETKPE